MLDAKTHMFVKADMCGKGGFS